MQDIWRDCVNELERVRAANPEPLWKRVKVRDYVRLANDWSVEPHGDETRKRWVRVDRFSIRSDKDQFPFVAAENGFVINKDKILEVSEAYLGKP